VSEEWIDPETIEQVSKHSIYGIVEDYGHIQIREVWYRYDPHQDRLVRFTKSPHEDLFACPAINETPLI
jgi:hypothetical protein